MGKRKTYSTEQIIMKLREVDVLIAPAGTHECQCYTEHLCSHDRGHAE
jgi:hypothetical protein